MHWLRCDDCGHIFTEGYYTDECCNLIFSKANEHQTIGHDFERKRYIASKMVDKVLPYASSGTWLDVGFGDGALLLTAHEYGFDPVGIDLREENVQALANLGVRSFCGDIAELKLDEPCSVISMADVLEHIPYPAEALKAANRLLDQDGILLISTPNIDSFAWRILDGQKANPYWGELEHYHSFGRVRLYELLKHCGFTPVRYGISARYRLGMEVLAQKHRD
ncbi:class I SAM-dependent methyltransferase [Mesorhizobium denitrificans]|uniref:Class I SAM-dependent methyltransferase n=1 Tax=Mesorhizobium denitrificans TaxID=2294114 RepID=A0A371XGG9_9HYPH|nr:class I SAM-dependent methyltransferase [Mesorhizobium denitrificans]